MTTCPVTILVSARNGKRRPCGRPVERMGLCAIHAADHERLCDGGCRRCGR